jgi:hypothetical protein
MADRAVVYIHDACPSAIIGRRAEMLWTDLDERGTFAVVRMLDGQPVSYGDPDGFTVVCTSWGPRPPAPPSRVRLPDERLCRWLPRQGGPGHG